MQEAAEAANDSGQEEDGNGNSHNKASKKRKSQYNGLPAGHPAMKKAKMAVPAHKKGPKRELKRPEEILKARKMQAKNSMKQKKGKKSKGGGGRKR